MILTDVIISSFIRQNDIFNAQTLNLWIEQFDLYQIKYLYLLLFGSKPKFNTVTHNIDCTCEFKPPGFEKFQYCVKRREIINSSYVVGKCIEFPGYPLQYNNEEILITFPQHGVSIDDYYNYYTSKNYPTIIEYSFVLFLQRYKAKFKAILPPAWRENFRVKFQTIPKTRGWYLTMWEEYKNMPILEFSNNDLYCFWFKKPEYVDKYVENSIVQYKYSTPLFIYDKIGDFNNILDLYGNIIGKNKIITRGLNITLLLTKIKNIYYALDIYRYNGENVAQFDVKTRYSLLMDFIEKNKQINKMAKTLKNQDSRSDKIIKIKLAPLINPHEVEHQYYKLLGSVSKYEIFYSGLIFKTDAGTFEYPFNMPTYHIFMKDKKITVYGDNANNEYNNDENLIIPGNNMVFSGKYLCIVVDNILHALIFDVYRFRPYFKFGNNQDLGLKIIKTKLLNIDLFGVKTKYSTFICKIWHLNFINNIPQNFIHIETSPFYSLQDTMSLFKLSNR